MNISHHKNLIKESIKKIFTLNSLIILGFDLAFIISLALINYFFSINLNNFILAYNLNNYELVSIFYIFSYITLIIALYSFFKSLIISKLTNIKFSLEHFKNQFSLNLVLIFLIFIVLEGISFIHYNYIQESIQPYSIYIIPFIIIESFYLLTYSQTYSMIHNKGVIESIANSFKHKISKDFFKLLIINLTLIIVYLLLYYIIGTTLNSIFNLVNTDSALIKYNITFTIITLIFIYLIMVFNRFYIHSLLKK